MKQKRLGLGVAVLAALTLAGGSTSVAQANDGYGGEGRKAGHDIIVKGDHNQIVVGNDNTVARGDINRNTDGDEGEDTSTPAQPYATVNSLVTTFLSERARPTTASAEVARFSRGTQIPIECLTHGQSVGGDTGWYQVRTDPGFVFGYVSAHFVNLTGHVRLCDPA
jgi:hypothetical protein